MQGEEIMNRTRTLHVIVLAHHCLPQREGVLMSHVLCHIQSHSHQGPIRVYLFAGYDSVQSMRKWLQGRNLPEDTHVESATGDLRTHEMLGFVARKIGDQTEPVTVFGEKCDRFYLRRLVQVIFPDSDTPDVKGVELQFENLWPLRDLTGWTMSPLRMIRYALRTPPLPDQGRAAAYRSFELGVGRGD